MNSVLEEFAHNPIIDEIVYWPPRRKRLLRIERDIPASGNCRVTLKFDDKSTEIVEIKRGGFELHWNEAIAVITALLKIEGDLRPLSKAEIDSLEADRQEIEARKRDQISKDVFRLKQQALQYAKELFDAGEYDLFLQQFGPDTSDLSPVFEKRIAIAIKKIQTKA